MHLKGVCYCSMSDCCKIESVAICIEVEYVTSRNFHNKVCLNYRLLFPCENIIKLLIINGAYNLFNLHVIYSMYMQAVRNSLMSDCC